MYTIPMEYTLQIKLEDHETIDDLVNLTSGKEWRSACFDFYNTTLRTLVKHGNYPDETQVVLEQIRDAFFQSLESYELKLD